MTCLRSPLGFLPQKAYHRQGLFPAVCTTFPPAHGPRSGKPTGPSEPAESSWFPMRPVRRHRTRSTDTSRSCTADAAAPSFIKETRRDLSFPPGRLFKRFPYRAVDGHCFYSLAFEVHYENPGDTVPVLHPAPLATALAFLERNFLPARCISCPDGRPKPSTTSRESRPMRSRYDPGRNSCRALPPGWKSKQSPRVIQEFPIDALAGHTAPFQERS